MANLDFEDDLNYSIALSFDRRLNEDYLPLAGWFADTLFTAQELQRGRRRRVTEILSCVLSNLLYAANIDRRLFVGAPFRPQAFQQNRYNNSGIGYRNFERVIQRLREHVDNFVDFAPGIHFPHIRRNGRIRATARTLRIIYGVIAHIRENAGIPIQNLNERINVILAANQIDNFVIGREDIVEGVREPIILRDENRTNIDYVDTAETDAMRARLTSWNSFCAEKLSRRHPHKRQRS